MTSTLSRLLHVLVVAVVIVTVVSRLGSADFFLSMWSDRDLVRSSQVFVDWPTSGAEMNGGSGARVPGGAYHWLLAIPLAARHDPLDVYRFLLLMDVAAMALLAWWTDRRHGELASAAVMAVWVTAMPARIPMGWLWNPAATPLFAAVGLWAAGAVLEGGQRRMAVLWGVALALGAHVHASVGMLWVWTAVGMAWMAPRRARRAIPWAAGAGALTWLPYVLAELQHGAANTALLGQQSPSFPSETTTLAWQFVAKLADAGRFLLPDLATWSAAPALAIQAAWGLLALGGGVVAMRADEPQWRLVRLAWLALVMSAVVPAVGTTPHLEWRYLTATVPCLALILGTTVGWLGARHAALGAVALLLLTAPAASTVAHDLPHQLDALRRGPTLSGIATERSRRVVLDQVQRATGQPLDAIVGRLLYVRRVGSDSWETAEHLPLDFQLRREGMQPTGSLPPPCLALVGPDAPPADALTALLTRVRGPGRHRVISAEPVGSDMTLVTWDTPSRHCPTNLANRYLATEAERVLMPLFHALADREVRVLPHPDGSRVAVALPTPPGDQGRVVLGVDLLPTPDGARVVLHSHQLRGFGMNGGSFYNGLIGDPTVVFTAPDGRTTEAVMHEGMVGGNHVITPLQAGVTLPAGTYTVTLETTVYALPERSLVWPVEPVAERAEALVLLETLVVD